MARYDQVSPFSSQKSTIQSRPVAKGPTITSQWRNARHAAKTLVEMLGNSLACTGVGWLLAFCISLGNAISSRAPGEQTYTEFLAIKILWFDVFYWTIGLATSVYKLLPERFVAHPTQGRLTFLQILVKLAPPMLPFVLGVTFMSVGGAVGIASLPPSVHKFKLDLYWSFICCAFFVAAVDTQTRHIYKNETVAGQTREQRRLHAKLPSASPPRLHRRRPSAAQYLHVLCQSLPFCLSSLFAAAYAHAVSSIPMESQWSITTFAAASVGLKALLQEIIKCYLSKQRQTPASRSIAILIAVPTILVDTQVRTVLLCQDTVSSTLLGSSLLAVVEIAMRLARSFHVARKQRSLTQRIIPRTAGGHVDPKPPSTTSPDQRSLSQAKKMMMMHAAEVYTDMNAEYIAMGCSYAILFFFGSHDKFNLGDQNDASYAIFPVTIALQVGIELIVDFVSSMLEIRLGVDFESFNQDGAYLTFFMMVIAVTNIHISSGIYLKE